MSNKSTLRVSGADMSDGEPAVASPDRRRFLRAAGITLTLATVGCGDEDGPTGDGDRIDLGSGDTGILNYFYALAQLETAFFAQVIRTPYVAVTIEEMTALIEIHDHELVHREVLKAALGDSAIASLEVDFSVVNFTSRGNVLGTAQTFENLACAAFNGVGNLLGDLDFLLLTSKIVSVKARHAGAILDVLHPNSEDFASDSIVDSNGLGLALPPADVWAIADPYVVTEIDTSSLPTNP